MQITETLNNGLKRTIQVTVTAAQLAEKMEKRLEELRSTANIKGFRPGRVPVAHLKKMYGDSIMAELVNDSITQASQSIATERGERPAATPKVEINESKEEIDNVISGKSDLVFSLSYEVLPEVDTSDVQTIEIEREIVELSDEEVEEQLLKALENTRTYTTKDGAAENGDRLTIDYLGKLDGEPFEGGAAKGAHLVLGSNSFIPGFEDQLVGTKAGDEKAINVTFPEEYHAAHLAGKAVVFEVVVHEVAAADELVVDDEAAKKLGLESVDKLREAVRNQMESYFGSFTRQKVKKQILDALDAKYSFELPEELVEGEFNGIWNRVVEEMKHEGQTFESEGLVEEDEKNEYRRLAERRVRLGLVLSEYGRVVDVKVSEEELQRALYDQLRQYPGQEQQIYEMYQSNPQMIDMLRAPVFEEKVIDHVLSQIKVTDKVVSKEVLVNLDAEAEKPSEAKDSAPKKKKSSKK